MPQPSKRRRQELAASRNTSSKRASAPLPDRYRPRRVTVSRPWWRSPGALIGGTAGAVIAVVVIFIVLADLGSSSASAPISPLPIASDSVVRAVTGVTTQVSDTVGSGGISNPLQALPATAAKLTGADGNPEVFYLGAEFCPFCAAERWSVVVALSRFGTFTDLRLLTSSSTDNYPNTHTFSFYGSSYSSQYLDFVPLETATRTQGQTLQTPTDAQDVLIETYDTSPYSSKTGGIPFMDFGNVYVASGTAVNPQYLAGLSWQQIANDLSDPTNTVAQAIIGNANYLTAGICKLTGNLPASVCGDTVIAALESQLGS